jgi:hypothetical protein
MRLALLLLSFIPLISFADVTASAGHPPKLLIIGDSISVRYALFVRKELSGLFEVQHACSHGGWCNNGQTDAILGNMKNYFRDGDADVTTFNSGIHDMTFEDQTTCDSKSLRIPPNQYQRNIDVIDSYLKAHSKIVIWVDTTNVPVGVCATNTLKSQYNAIAEKIAHEHGFYVLNIDSKFQEQKNFHFTEKGYEYLAKQVSNCIRIAQRGDQTSACHR